METCVDEISRIDMLLMDLHGQGILSGYTAESLAQIFGPSLKRSAIHTLRLQKQCHESLNALRTKPGPSTYRCFLRC